MVTIIILGCLLITINWYFPKDKYPGVRTSDYWEQYTWIHMYGGNIEKARETWPWRTSDGKSTWKDCFLLDFSD